MEPVIRGTAAFLGRVSQEMAFEDQSGITDKKGHLAALTIVICLYVMSLLPLFTVTCSAYLFAAHTVDQANGVSEVLIIISVS